MNLITIFVCTPDSYADVFDVFLQFYKENMDVSQFPLTIATNEKNYPSYNVIHSDKKEDNWTYRANYALKHIQTEFVLLMCDDIFIKRSPNIEKIKEILTFMELNNIDFCRLEPSKKGKKIRGLHCLSYIDKRMPYGLNLQYGIYRTSFLKEIVLNVSKSAWDIENEWNNLSSSASRGYFKNCVVSRHNYFPVYHAIVKGKWLPSVYKVCSKKGHLLSTNRGILTKSQETMFLFKHFLSNHLPFCLRKFIKKTLNKLGFKFVTDK